VTFAARVQTLDRSGAPRKLSVATLAELGSRPRAKHGTDQVARCRHSLRRASSRAMRPSHLGRRDPPVSRDRDPSLRSGMTAKMACVQLRAKHGTNQSRGAVIRCAAHRQARRARRGATLENLLSSCGRRLSPPAYRAWGERRQGDAGQRAPRFARHAIETPSSGASCETGILPGGYPTPARRPSAARRALEPLGLPRRGLPRLGYCGETIRAVTCAARVNPRPLRRPTRSERRDTRGARIATPCEARNKPCCAAPSSTAPRIVTRDAPEGAPPQKTFFFLRPTTLATRIPGLGREAAGRRGGWGPGSARYANRNPIPIRVARSWG